MDCRLKKPHFRRRTKMKKFGTLSFVMLVAASFFVLAAAPPAVAGDVTYSFTLTGPQSSASANNHTITLTGGGSFDPTAGTVVASGSFTTTNNSNGAVIHRGTWSATAFTSFCSRGGPNPGVQGGVLVIIVTLFPNGGSPITGLAMTVNCLVGSGCSPGDEGVTLGDFTTIVRGRTLFHINE
jgi:hypothetical protein